MKTPGTKAPRTKRLLLVEPDSADSAAAALEGFGYEVVVERSEAAAKTRLLSDERIGLVLLDVDLDGSDACARLATLLPTIRDIPVVFLDVRPGGAASDRLKGVPRYGYIGKNAGPFIFRSVLETAFELFEARSRLSARIKNLNQINEYSLRLEELPADELRAFALNRMRSIFKAEVAAFSSYDPERRELVLESYSKSDTQNTPLIDFVGRRLVGIKIQLTPENYSRIVEEKVGVMSSIHDLSFGMIPRRLGALIEKMIGLGWFQGVALLSGGELFGSLGLIGSAGGVPPDSGELLAFAEITAGAIKRKAAEQRIRHLLAEKELLLREVHHRIKNNMATVIGLLDLQSESVEDEAAVSALREAKSRLQSMGILYEKLYQTENLREISLGEYIPDLAAEVVGMFPKGGSVRIETRIEEFTLPVKTVAVLGIILNELFTNAMKHAFRGREQGNILITASHKREKIVIEVRDDGVGMPANLNPLETSSFGLNLVQILTEQLGGSVRFEQRAGTAAILDLPLPAVLKTGGASED